MNSEATNTKQESWNNYWQGRQAKNSGSALVGIEDNIEIESFWQSELSKFERGAGVADLACGAGTVLKVLSGLGFTDLHGVDISEAAIKVLQAQLPHVTGVVSGLESIPYTDTRFDILVSQFGFEYAAMDKALPEIARTLTPKGSLIFLSHKRGSAIHNEVLKKREQMLAFKDMDIFGVSKELFLVAMTNTGRRSAEEVSIEFQKKRKALEALAKTNGGLASYFLMGIKQMFERRSNYALEDIHQWIDANVHEINRFIGRMDSMDKAALSESDVNNLKDGLAGYSISMETPDTLTDEKNQELGWVIKAQKERV